MAEVEAAAAAMAVRPAKRKASVSKTGLTADSSSKPAVPPAKRKASASKTALTANSSSKSAGAAGQASQVSQATQDCIVVKRD